MSISVSRLSLLALVIATLVSGALMTGADDSTSYKGLELTAKSVERATRVSLQDCPPGANIVRGVIRLPKTTSSRRSEST